MNDIRALGVNDNADQPTLSRPASATQTAQKAVKQMRAARAETTRVNGVRVNLVHAIRAQIASGAYDTDAKLNGAVDAMLDSVDSASDDLN